MLARVFSGVTVGLILNFIWVTIKLMNNQRRKVVNLGSILSKLKKGWIALSPDNKYLVATGSTLNEVLEKSKKVGVDNPSVLKAAPVKNFMVG